MFPLPLESIDLVTDESDTAAIFVYIIFFFRLFVIFTSVKRIEGWARQWVSSMPYIGEGLIGLRGRGEEIHRVGLFDLFFYIPLFIPISTVTSYVWATF